MISGKGIGKCGKVEKKDLFKMERLDEEVNTRLMSIAPKNVPLPPSSFQLVVVVGGWIHPLTPEKGRLEVRVED